MASVEDSSEVPPPTRVTTVTSTVRKIHRTLAPFETAILVVTLVGFIVYSLMFLMAMRQLELFVWIDERDELDLSSPALEPAIEAILKDARASSARLLDLRVANYGSAYIGEQTTPWTLTLPISGAERIVVVPPVTTFPKSMRRPTHDTPTDAQNVLRLTLGILEPLNDIRVRIVAINGDFPTMGTPIASLAGLGTPQIQSATNVFGLRFMPLAFVIMVAALVVEHGRSEWNALQARSGLRLVLYATPRLVGVVFVLAVFTALLSLLFGAVMAGLLQAQTVYPRFIDWLFG